MASDTLGINAYKPFIMKKQKPNLQTAFTSDHHNLSIPTIRHFLACSKSLAISYDATLL